ncbi:MAG TPA: Npt1/Npt2 family nucleotide transporter [Acidobacteriota bacterium]|nr:Npt1/Npt2 family nucleotide transporter [Acidobacteriota bacterium]
MDFLGRVLQVRREEASSVALMAVYFFLAMASVNLIKALQNALYLGRVGFDWRLPLISLFLALLAGPVVLIYRRLGSRFSNVWINGLTLSVLFLNLVAFSLLSQAGMNWVYPIFYLWGGIVSVLLPMLGWVISYNLYTTRQAKRLFSLLGAGGIAGGVFGGYFALFGARWFSSESMMLQVAALLGLMLGLLVLVQRTNRTVLKERDPASGERRVRSRGGTVQGMRDLFQSRYLRLLAACMLMTGLVTSIIDLQYKWELDRAFPGAEQDIARFFGAVLGTAFALSALLQLFATGRILRRFGMRASLPVLPASLLGGSLALMITSAFWATVSLRLVDGSLRNSIYRTSAEILFMPVSGPHTVAAKGVIDLAASRLGDALAAAGFLVVVIYLGAGPAVVGVLVAAGALLWLLLTLRVHDGYLKALRQSLEIKADPGSREAFRSGEAVAQRTLLRALSSRNPSKLEFALSQLAGQSPDSDNGSGAYTMSGDTLLQSLYPSESPNWLSQVEPLLESPKRSVAAAALAVMIRYEPDTYSKRLNQALTGDAIPPLNYLEYLNRYVSRPARYLHPERVLRWCRDASRPEAVALARLMGKSRNPAFARQLLKWARQERSVRARAAMEAIGQLRDPQAVDLLVARLADNWSRVSARKALSCYGDEVVERLQKLLIERNVDPDIKREIPYVLTQINTHASRAGLVAALYLPDVTVSYRALKGLNKIRDESDLSYNQASFLPVLQLWARQYYQLLNLSSAVGEARDAGSKLLSDTVHQRMEWTIEKIFRALGLFFPAGDAYFSYVGYTSDRSELRANAVELIDSRMPGELRTTLLPIFIHDEPRLVVATGRRLFSLPSDPARILSEGLFERDPWLKVCILAALVHREPAQFESRVRQALNDVHPRVRETAAWVLDQWEAA